MAGVHHTKDGLRLRAPLALALALAAISPASAAALSDVPDAPVVVTNGPVYAVAQTAGKTYIGGDFTRVGVRTGTGVPLAAGGAVGGPPPVPFPEVAGGPVDAVVADGHGGWFIGGEFSSVGALARSGLAHVCADGSVDPTFSVAADGPVRALVLAPAGAPDQDTLYVGGSFTQIGGRRLAYLAAVQVTNGEACPASGSVISAWSPQPNGDVYALQGRELPLQDNAKPPNPVTVPVLFVGGNVTQIGAQSSGQTAAHQLAAVWGVAARDEKGQSIAGISPNWTPSTGGVVRALAASQPVTDKSSATTEDVAVYAGGDPAAGGTNPLIAAYFSVAVGGRSPSFTGTYANWAPAVTCPAGVTPCDPTVRALALDGSTTPATLYVGGDYGQIAGQPVRGLAALTGVNPSDSQSPAPSVTSWRPSADGFVRSLAYSASAAEVYAGGDFGQIGTTPRDGLAAIGADGTPDPAWNPRPAGGAVGALALAGSSVYVGGAFTALGAQPRERLAAIDADGSLDPSWAACSSPSDAGCGADGPVEALAVAPDATTLYVGGGFAKLGGLGDRPYLGALDLASGAPTAWRPAGAPDGWVLALAVSGSTLYAGGSFTHLGGDARRRVAALDTTSGALTGWNPDASDNVYALAAGCGVVYAGGGFHSQYGEATIGGAVRDGIAALDTATGAATGWAPNPQGTVYAIVPYGDRVYVGGHFYLIGGAVRDSLAALDTASGAAAGGWNPRADFGPSPSTVRALAVSGDGTVLYVGGDFDTVAGAARDHLAALDRASGAALDWNPSPDDSVDALAASGANLYVGGSFAEVGSGTQAGSGMQEGFARFTGGADATAALVCPPPPPERRHRHRPRRRPPPPPPPPPPPDTSPPVVTSFRVSDPLFRVVGARAGRSGARARRRSARRRARVHRRPHVRPRRLPSSTTFVYEVSEAGKATIAIERALPGRLLGASCLAPTRALRTARPCTRYREVGLLSATAAAGSNRLRFDGRIGTRALAAGAYRATLLVTDAAGNVSAPRQTGFKTTT